MLRLERLAAIALQRALDESALGVVQIEAPLVVAFQPSGASTLQGVLGVVQQSPARDDILAAVEDLLNDFQHRRAALHIRLPSCSAKCRSIIGFIRYFLLPFPPVGNVGCQPRATMESFSAFTIPEMNLLSLLSYAVTSPAEVVKTTAKDPSCFHAQ